MIDNIKISLVRKYLSVGAIGLLGVVLTFTIINTKYQNTNLRELHLQQAKDFLTIVEGSTAEDIYSMRIDRLRQTINYMKKDHAVVDIVIIDNNEKVITNGNVDSAIENESVNDPLLYKSLAADKIEWEIRNENIYLFIPAELPNIKLGAIKLVYSLHQLKETELSVLFNNLKFAVIIFIIGFTLMLFFVRRIVVPIKQLIKGTIEVTEGNYDQNIEIETRDELEVLSTSFNKMVKEVKQSRDEMINAKEKAEASDKLKTEFLAQISHEIRTPINAIVNFTELLKSDFEHKLYGETKESFDIIKHSSDRLIRTIDLIINMSEIQTGSFKADFEKVDLYNEIITPLIKDFRPEIGDRPISLTAENHSEHFEVQGDKYSLKFLFANLLDNAIKYTNEGEIKIIFEEIDNDKLQVHVMDTGIGIADEFMPFLFEPFMQEYHGYTRKYEGTGLGLALVKKYCEINNAEIKIDTKKDVGTKFTITFELLKS